MADRPNKPNRPKRLPNGRFPKGVCGNPRGRPKSNHETLDFEKIVDGLVPVKRNGKLGAAPRKEAALTKHLAIALDATRGARARLKAIAWLLEQFEAHDILVPPPNSAGGGVVTAPNTMPWPMAQWIAFNVGGPPFTAAQIAQGRAEYIATRSKEQAEIDRLIGYPDLVEQERER